MIITFTDFGIQGPYMGQMRARLLKEAPGCEIVDLMCDVPSFNVLAASCLLSYLSKDMPKKAVYLCVVDPGVGSSRKPICLQIGDCYFVGPDNGLFTHIINENESVKAFEILWRPPHMSVSFHGRDLFAPVAAALEQGKFLNLAEIPVNDLVMLDVNIAQIIYIDHYGNCWTNLAKESVSENNTFIINDKTLHFAHVFHDSPPNMPFWYINSAGLVEFAVNQGNASLALDLKTGSKFQHQTKKQ